MSDKDLEDVVGKIAELALASDDPEDANTQWHLGYQQACRDIVLMVARLANKRRSVTEGLPTDTKTL